ncbi:uncharacterized protein LOC131888793 isoform X2 [Tigriopus californicus]|uniref:uncharacterized protein LOC131888793 isoform X2 n=1 Tax=Tigriopus californicus TaxID=6832 RepID=UPI0027DAB146|nr:uncharacterized protein LOC131888793 isoform X2 [Tigriopus californicus]
MFCLKVFLVLGSINVGFSNGDSIMPKRLDDDIPTSSDQSYNYEEGSCETNQDCLAPQVCLYEVCTLEKVDLVDMNSHMSSQTEEYGTNEDVSEPSTNRFEEERVENVDSLDEREDLEESHLETTILKSNSGASKRSKNKETHNVADKGNRNATEEMVLDSSSLNDKQAFGNQVIINEEEKKDADLITNAKFTDEQSKLQNNKEDQENLLGSYKFPDTCQHHKLGDCRFVIKWSKTSNPGEIRFEVQSQNKKWTALGMSHSTKLVGADVITVTRKGSIQDRFVNSQRSVSKDKRDNLIHPLVTVKEGILIGKFTKKMKNEDPEQDIDLSDTDGIIMFVPGGEVGSNKSYSFLPEKINLTQYAHKHDQEPVLDQQSIGTGTDQPVINEMINFSYEDPPDRSPEIPIGKEVPLTSADLHEHIITEDPHTITMDIDVNYLVEQNDDANKHLVAPKPFTPIIEQPSKGALFSHEG